MRRATTTMYIVPANPTNPHRIAAGAIACQGTRIKADRSSAALKCTTLGEENAAPASGDASCGLSASSVMTTNCRPISAPAAAPTMM